MTPSDLVASLPVPTHWPDTGQRMSLGARTAYALALWTACEALSQKEGASA
jgi:hypothetical protein